VKEVEKKNKQKINHHLYLQSDWKIFQIKLSKKHLKEPNQKWNLKFRCIEKKNESTLNNYQLKNIAKKRNDRRRYLSCTKRKILVG